MLQPRELAGSPVASPSCGNPGQHTSQGCSTVLEPATALQLFFSLHPSRAGRPAGQAALGQAGRPGERAGWHGARQDAGRSSPRCQAGNTIPRPKPDNGQGEICNAWD